jgi:aspartyl-tRNA synthetase
VPWPRRPPAAEEIKTATAMGFELETKVLVKATPEEAYTVPGRVGE